jgi:5'-methylthioadenosine phosphorylase
MLALLCGSGLERPDFLEQPEAASGGEGAKTPEGRLAGTPYGMPSGQVRRGLLGGEAVLFLARHGEAHAVPPHRINYRANLWALREAGATAVAAQGTAGGIDRAPCGQIAVPDQILDYTWGREQTFFDGGDAPVRHIDFTWPYDDGLRQALLLAAKKAGVAVRDGGAYAATQGPRLETAAEVRRLKNDGASFVGMTGMPEAALARELGLPYAAVVLVANDAAGLGASKGQVSLAQLQERQAEGIRRICAMFKALPAAWRGLQEGGG